MENECGNIHFLFYINLICESVANLPYKQPLIPYSKFA